MPEETNIAYVTVVLVTLLTLVSADSTKLVLGSGDICLHCFMKNLFKKQSAKFIRRVLRKLWRNKFWCVFYAPQCISSPQRIADHMYMHTAKNNYI